MKTRAAVCAAACCAVGLAGCASAPGYFPQPQVAAPLAVLEARLAADTNDPVAYYDLALACWRERAYGRADTLLDEATTLDPEFALAHLAKALVQLANEDRWKEIRRRGGDTAVVQESRYREREYARAFMIDPFLDVRTVGLLGVSYDSAYSSLSATMDSYTERLGILRDSQPRALLWMHVVAAVHLDPLIESAAGDRVVLQAPGGTEYLTVLEVRYERISVEPFREPPGSETSPKGHHRRR